MHTKSCYQYQAHCRVFHTALIPKSLIVTAHHNTTLFCPLGTHFFPTMRSLSHTARTHPSDQDFVCDYVRTTTRCERARKNKEAMMEGKVAVVVVVVENFSPRSSSSSSLTGWLLLAFRCPTTSTVHFRVQFVQLLRPPLTWIPRVNDAPLAGEHFPHEIAPV